MQRRRTRKNVVGFARPHYDNLKTYKPTLKLGCMGESVELLQSLLITKGYFIKIDGVFGPKTKEAVKEFQKSVELKPDGIVGPLTWKELTK